MVRQIHSDMYTYIQQDYLERFYNMQQYYEQYASKVAWEELYKDWTSFYINWRCQISFQHESTKSSLIELFINDCDLVNHSTLHVVLTHQSKVSQMCVLTPEQQQLKNEYEAIMRVTLARIHSLIESYYNIADSQTKVLLKSIKGYFDEVVR